MPSLRIADSPAEVVGHPKKEVTFSGAESTPRLSCEAPGKIHASGSAVVSGVERIYPVPPELEPGVNAVTPVLDHQAIFILDHRVHEKLLCPDIGASNASRDTSAECEVQKAGTMIVGVGYSQTFSHVTQAVINASIVHKHVIDSDPRFIQDAWAEAMGPVEDAVAQACDTKG